MIDCLEKQARQRLENTYIMEMLPADDSIDFTIEINVIKFKKAMIAQLEIRTAK